MTRPSKASIAACIMAATIATAFAQPSLAQSNTSGTAREVITAANQLPRRTVLLQKLPSAYLDADRAELLKLAQLYETNLRADLSRFDIQDAATLRAYYAQLLLLLQFREAWSELPAVVEALRNLQEKPGSKAVTGVMAGIIADHRSRGLDAASVQREVTQRYGALNWGDASDEIRQIKASVELMNLEATRGAFVQQVDVAAQNMQLNVPEGLIGSIIGARWQREAVWPLKAPIIAGLQVVVDRNASSVVKPDIWTPRQFAIPSSARATEVAIGIWDSGVDTTLFKTTAQAGTAFDGEFRSASSLLRPLGDAQSRWPELRQYIKGAFDLRAALDTEDARKLRASVSSLRADQVKAFQEDLRLASLYTHGTHVAGIAVDGNPFARVFTAAMYMNHRTEPIKPDEALSQRTAQAYRDIVRSFKQQNVRVVNMSWRYSATALEAMLTWHNVGANADDRKRIASRLFAIERDALRAAIASAPEILFIAASGNEDNSADFEEYIPAGFQLPNLLTVGAVDKAGDETSFSTFGKTVTLHANGFEVQSLLPGGSQAQFSGTSMASPQVANLAAKLLALRPELSVAQLKQAIIDAADKRGRVTLINPRRSAELLGIRL